MHRLFTLWLVSVLTSWAPPGRKHEQFPAARETEQEAIVRYHSLATDVLDVAFDPAEAPLFGGPEWKARANTALLMASIILKESGLRKDVDTGEGKHARGDNGRSVCVMQVNVGDGLVPLDGEPGTWGAKELLSDRKKCLRAGLGLMRRSFNACRGPLEYRLASYASGRCDAGKQASANRIRAFLRARDLHPLLLPK